MSNNKISLNEFFFFKLFCKSLLQLKYNNINTNSAKNIYLLLGSRAQKWTYNVFHSSALKILV